MNSHRFWIDGLTLKHQRCPIVTSESEVQKFGAIHSEAQSILHGSLTTVVRSMGKFLE